MKYRKKPVIIDAVQFNKLGDHPAVLADLASPTGYGIHTLESTKTTHEVTPGDWIITGVKGEVYACKNDIFRMTYEPVPEPQTTPKVKGQSPELAAFAGLLYRTYCKEVSGGDARPTWDMVSNDHCHVQKFLGWMSVATTAIVVIASTQGKLPAQILAELTPLPPPAPSNYGGLA